MQIGISTNPRGRLAGPAAARAIAQAAEQLGYSSIWVGDDPRWVPRAGDDGDDGDEGDGDDVPTDGDGLDPLSLLVAVATVTSQVRVGAELRLSPWYQPAALARSLRSLDVLSDGRLTVGLILGGADGNDGSNEDGNDGAAGDGGAPDRARAVLDRLELAPRRPLVLVSAADPMAVAGDDHLARRLDGWHARGAPIDQLAARWDVVRRSIAAADGGGPLFVVPAPVQLTATPVAGARAAFHGDIDQVAADLESVHRAGADEVVLAIDGDAGLDETLDVYARVAEAIEARAGR